MIINRIHAEFVGHPTFRDLQYYFVHIICQMRFTKGVRDSTASPQFRRDINSDIYTRRIVKPAPKLCGNAINHPISDQT